MRAPHLKTRIVLPVALGLFGIAAAVAAGVGWAERRGIDADLARTLKGAEANLRARLDADGAAMAAALPFVCDDRKVTEAFLSRSRLRLQSVGEPLLERFRHQRVASELAFLDGYLTYTYQAHNPQAPAERSTRPTALAAQKSGRATTGLEVDRTGALVLRTVRPWSVGGQVVGYVEAGRSVQDVLRDLREAQGVEAYALVDRPATSNSATERAERVLEASAGGAATQSSLPREAIFSDAGTQPSAELKAFIAAHPAGDPTVGGTSAAEFSANGKRYHAGFVPLADADGRRLGRVLIVRDTTAAAADARFLSRGIAGLSAVAVALLSLLLYGPVRRLHRRAMTTQQQLLQQANHDPLTGLPTRRTFLEHLDGVIRQRAKKDRAFALLYLDFDRFKLVNDCVGHEAGDQLLKQVAARLRKALSLTKGGGVCTAGRLGADEFGVLIDPLSDANDASVVAQQILTTLAEPLIIKETDVVCTASVGITTSVLSTGTADDVLRDAHSALVRAQAGGRGRYEMFEPSMRSASSNRLSLERDLAKGIGRGELRLFYQPIVRMEDGKLVGFEGLVRWQHPTKGMVSPGEFIPLAEETGLILPLGMWVLEEGCRQLKEWRHGYPELQLTMSLNVSRKQLCFPDLVQRVEKLLVDNALPASSLKIEITESTVMEHGTQAIGVLHALRSLGTQLLMDDFGTGYSSLSCLHRFPLNGIKVDRAFIRNVSERQDYAAVVQAIVTLARNLGMYVVAEGVETEGQVAMLKGIDPDLLGQGYLFSKPIDAKAAEKFIQQHTPLSKAA